MVEKVEKGARIAWILGWGVWLLCANLGYLYAWAWFVMPAYEGVMADMGKWSSLFTVICLMGLTTTSVFGLLIVSNHIQDAGQDLIASIAARYKEPPTEEATE